MSATVAPDKLLRQLADLWTAEGKQGDSGVLRACSMTLCVLAESSDDTAALGETIAALMPEHPARAIMIRLSGPGERALADRVYQQCWMPFGQRRQICCEQIEITASDAALADLPSLLLPLAVPDLPVVLWCRSPRLAVMPEFRDIARMATKIIFDTAAFPTPADAVWQLADAQRRGLLVADLAWTRLTRWRECLARHFEGRPDQIQSIRAAFPPGLETTAWYLAAWTSNALRIAPTFAAGPLCLELTGPTLHVSITREAITVNGQSTCANFPPASDYAQMREELAIMRRDPAFEQTLNSAARLAVPRPS
jgi:glucose-6-phosphate dehydrogenase assembly protein OpcA